MSDSIKEEFTVDASTELVPSKEVPSQTITMTVGTIKVIALPSIARVAVGDSKIIQANTDDDKELILFARSEGKTTLEVWNTSGQRRSFEIDVRSAQAQELKEDILKIVQRISNAKASIVGDKIIIEGDRLSDADRERIQKLTTYYPQIVDMSSQIGWDEMVMLDVQIVELPRHYVQELGVKWGASSQGGFQIGGVVDSYSSSLLRRPGDVLLDTVAGARAGYAGLNALLSSTIQAMADNGQAVILAQPQLMARSGATAEFLAGGEVPYSVVDANGNTQTIFKPYGVSLYITPRIEKNGIIRSKINVEVSAVDSSMNLAGGPALKTRRTSTEFNVKSGEPLVLSGFISRDQMQGMARLPGVSEIPILGELFRSRRFQSNETELVIIVRPLVVSANNRQMRQRVARTRAVVDSSFEERPILNVDIQPELSPVIEKERFSEEDRRLTDKYASAEDFQPLAEHLQFKVVKTPPRLRTINKKTKSRVVLPVKE
ncbi:secretion protein [Pelistega europaea]|uniref:Secretion protein n=2 Tax=Pelistega europaea TaxID=106147 RepID=A0A7Y4L8D4_9BURK|nr:secretion protein [Pelistega europaea]